MFFMDGRHGLGKNEDFVRCLWYFFFYINRPWWVWLHLWTSASVWVKPEAMHERLSRRSPCLPPSFRDMKHTPNILVFYWDVCLVFGSFFGVSLCNTFATNSLQYFISIFGHFLWHGCCIRFDFWNNVLFSELNGLFCMYVDYVVVHHSCPPGALRGGFLGAVSLLFKARDSQGSDSSELTSRKHIRCPMSQPQPVWNVFQLGVNP